MVVWRRHPTAQLFVYVRPNPPVSMIQHGIFHTELFAERCWCFLFCLAEYRVDFRWHEQSCEMLSDNGVYCVVRATAAECIDSSYFRQAPHREFAVLSYHLLSETSKLKVVRQVPYSDPPTAHGTHSREFLFIPHAPPSFTTLCRHDTQVRSCWASKFPDFPIFAYFSPTKRARSPFLCVAYSLAVE